jgi:hypothetical protein
LTALRAQSWTFRLADESYILQGIDPMLGI